MMEAILLSSHGESDQADKLIDQALDLLPQDNYFSRSLLCYIMRLHIQCR